jgi:hypothetical protein
MQFVQENLDAILFSLFCIVFVLGYRLGHHIGHERGWIAGRYSSRRHPSTRGDK